MEDIEYYSIPVYNFPFDEEEDDEETILDNSELRVRSPFKCPFLLKILTTPRSVEPHAVRARRFRGRYHDQWGSDPREAVSVGDRRGG